MQTAGLLASMLKWFSISNSCSRLPTPTCEIVSLDFAMGNTIAESLVHHRDNMAYQGDAV